jgi:hypothetical protein
MIAYVCAVRYLVCLRVNLLSTGVLGISSPLSELSEVREDDLHSCSISTMEEKFIKDRSQAHMIESGRTYTVVQSLVGFFGRFMYS